MDARDHGEEFYEHGVMSHGWSTYLKSLHVPLVLSFPSRIPTGKTVAEPITLRDLPATVIELLGVENKKQFPGSSLGRYWARPSDSGSSFTVPVFSELNLDSKGLPEEYPIVRAKGGLYSLVADRYHYIRAKDGSEQLYDFVNDPLERDDLSRNEKDREVLERFRASLNSILPVSGD